MTYEPETLFGSIESAEEYLQILAQAIGDTKRSVEEEIASEGNPHTVRRTEALRLVTYKLERLEEHIRRGCRILNDLRMLRRILSNRGAPAVISLDAPVIHKAQ